jgi:hypothetical protein
MTYERFLMSAREFAADALGSAQFWRMVPEDHRTMRRALFAGISLEYLAKAALCKRHPALIIDLGGTKDAWRGVAETVGHPAPRPGMKVKTISLTEAIDRLQEFVDLSRVPRTDLDAFIGLRNGGMHAGVASFDEKQQLTFLEMTDALLEDLGESRTSYWGNKLAAVQAQLGDSRTALATEARTRMAAARERVDAMPEGQYDSLVEFARAANPELREAPFGCPECAGPAIAVGSYGSGGEWREGDDQTFSVDTIGCQVCGLRLTAQEMKELKIDTLLDVDWPVDWEKIDPEPDWADIYAQEQTDRARGR